jgi:hypothetical protein
MYHLIFNIIYISEVKSKKGDDMSATNSNVGAETKCSTSTPAASVPHKLDEGMAGVMCYALKCI